MKAQDCKKKAANSLQNIPGTFVNLLNTTDKQIDLMHLNVCPYPVLIKKREKRERI